MAGDKDEVKGLFVTIRGKLLESLRRSQGIVLGDFDIFSGPGSVFISGKPVTV